MLRDKRRRHRRHGLVQVRRQKPVLRITYDEPRYFGIESLIISVQDEDVVFEKLAFIVLGGVI